uniref:Uncharacterized protein n=1 Tax=Globodera rostochiensis TaxID=31243 RepID=A0A914HJE4_GLORO
MEPVWVDEHDVHGQVLDIFIEQRVRGQLLQKNNRQRHKVRTIGTAHEWAQLSDADLHDNDEEELAAAQQMGGSAGVVAKGSKALHAKHLIFKVLRDVSAGHHQGAISDVKFHPIKPVLVTAATSGTISLFELCKEDANLELKKGDFFLQDVRFPRFRLDSIEFFDGGTSILASSANQNHLYTYDLLNGKVASIRHPVVLDSLRTRLTRLSADGTFVGLLANSADIFVFNFKTMEHLHTFRGCQNVVDFCFAPFDRKILYSLAVDGAVNTWNLRRCAEQKVFFDHGCVRATRLSCSRTGQFVACGSNTGIVNVYDLAKVAMDTEKSPKPVHTFDQLTTSVSFVGFSPDAQMMAFGSTAKRMACRLSNCSTGSVFQNYPAKQEHFSTDKFTACEFSPNNAFFSLGTKQGKLRLYRLGHSNSY